MDSGRGPLVMVRAGLWVGQIGSRSKFGRVQVGRGFYREYGLGPNLVAVLFFVGRVDFGFAAYDSWASTYLPHLAAVILSDPGAALTAADHRDLPNPAMECQRSWFRSADQSIILFDCILHNQDENLKLSSGLDSMLTGRRCSKADWTHSETWIDWYRQGPGDSMPACSSAIGRAGSDSLPP